MSLVPFLAPPLNRIVRILILLSGLKSACTLAFLARVFFGARLLVEILTERLLAR